MNQFMPSNTQGAEHYRSNSCFLQRELVEEQVCNAGVCFSYATIPGDPDKVIVILQDVFPWEGDGISHASSDVGTVV